MKKWKGLIIVLLVMTMMNVNPNGLSVISYENEAYAATVQKSVPKLSKKKMTIAVGDEDTIKLKNVTEQVKYKSEDTSIATVSKTGVIKACKIGTTKITLTYKKKTYTCQVSVIRREMEAAAKSVICCRDTLVKISLLHDDSEEGTTLNYEIKNPKIAKCSWGEWVDGTINLCIEPLQNGTTTIEITSDQTKQRLEIALRVVDAVSLDDSGTLTAKQIYAKSAKRVVQVNTDQAIGSGFFIDKGVVVTNYHVIEGASAIKVQMSTGDMYPVQKILGYDPDFDIAILAVNTKNDSFPINTHGVTIGETVYALGSPLGLTGSFSNGMVTNNHRVIDDESYIQTNVPLSTGNSGGPLINAYGEVIGINTFSYADGQNLNMSIDISQIYQISMSHPLTVDEFCKIDRGTGVTLEDESKSGSFATAQSLQIGTMLLGHYTNTQNSFDIYQFNVVTEGDYQFFLSAEAQSNQLCGAIVSGDDLENPIDSVKLGSNNIYKSCTVRLKPGTYFYVVYADDSTYQKQDSIPYFISVDAM